MNIAQISQRFLDAAFTRGRKDRLLLEVAARMSPLTRVRDLIVDYLPGTRKVAGLSGFVRNLLVKLIPDFTGRLGRCL